MPLKRFFLLFTPNSLLPNTVFFCLRTFSAHHNSPFFLLTERTIHRGEGRVSTVDTTSWWRIFIHSPPHSFTSLAGGSEKSSLQRSWTVLAAHRSGGGGEYLWRIPVLALLIIGLYFDPKAFFETFPGTDINCSIHLPPFRFKKVFSFFSSCSLYFPFCFPPPPRKRGNSEILKLNSGSNAFGSACSFHVDPDPVWIWMRLQCWPWSRLVQRRLW